MVKAQFKVGDVIKGKITAVNRNEDGTYSYRVEGLRDFIPESLISSSGVDLISPAKFSVGEKVGEATVIAMQQGLGEILYTTAETKVGVYSEVELRRE